MKKLYFTSPETSFIQDWDEVSPEPENIASFEFTGTPSTSARRYLLTPNNTYIVLYPTVADSDLDAFLDIQQLAPISPIKLKLAFTSEERVAIYASTKDIKLTATQEAFSLLVSEGLLTEARKLEILHSL
jgi:hypothetical protein